ncbi:hypothetical protein GE21DRAFT_3321 [Neurospora crassa]|uniref:Uncharacterized protein n=2 Tax=Neurospora crassa TaxID=5141 RepID=F5H936_NEUCR|nr:hypothetical protein NCU01684 [Neurospora crassa OR74A]EAA27654.2 hypothetical protein NCU01684 [Neurospora crassa OR74A]KHE82684.1 hypothetical protein GE21DRAFT_3321 [Neurospora crassa]CAB91274.2 hypothetical protein [Neurospora crassa]|eukprot:XP_956890.2 hypothetical protein NCU01684 [Neurospora crassa OR74A]
MVVSYLPPQHGNNTPSVKPVSRVPVPVPVPVLPVCQQASAEVLVLVASIQTPKPSPKGQGENFARLFSGLKMDIPMDTVMDCVRMEKTRVRKSWKRGKGLVHESRVRSRRAGNRSTSVPVSSMRHRPLVVAVAVVVAGCTPPDHHGRRRLKERAKLPWLHGTKSGLEAVFLEGLEQHQGNEWQSPSGAQVERSHALTNQERRAMESLKGCKNNGHGGGNEICAAHAHASKGSNRYNPAIIPVTSEEKAKGKKRLTAETREAGMRPIEGQ